MKLKSILLAATLVAFAASTATAFAVEEHPADAKTETGKVKRPETKKVKKHSHMEKKTGMSMPEAAPAAGKEMPAIGWRSGAMSNIKLFESKQIRSIWSEDDRKGYFSIVDVVAALTDSPKPFRPREWFPLPLPVIEKAIAMPLEVTILRHRYDVVACEFISEQAA